METRQTRTIAQGYEVAKLYRDYAGRAASRQVHPSVRARMSQPGNEPVELAPLDLEEWRNEAVELLELYPEQFGSEERIEFAKGALALAGEVAAVVNDTVSTVRRDEGLMMKLRGAAGTPWRTDGSAAPVQAYADLVRLLAGHSDAGLIVDAGTRRIGGTSAEGSASSLVAPATEYRVEVIYGVDLLGSLLAPHVALEVHGVDSLSAEPAVCVVPDEWLRLQRSDRIVALRQVSTLVLLDHQMPRTGSLKVVDPADMGGSK